MRTRPMQSPGRIFTMLQAAFEARRPPGCTRCKIPLPYAVPRPDEVSANWRIGTPATCPHHCEALIADIALDLAARYDMRDYALDEA